LVIPSKIQLFEREVDFFFRDDKRRRERKDVLPDPAAEKNDASRQHGFDDPARARGIRIALLIVDFDSAHQA